MITMLSDFGNKDAYVAVMKGVIAVIAPGIPTCDLTHQIPPQDILAARFNLLMAYPHFPPGTVHLAVVDPGVGSTRRAVALQCSNGFLVGPDNGLFSGVTDSEAPLNVVTLNNPAYWRVAHPSNTFHGRDIFAPAAAHLANGVPLTELGDCISTSELAYIDVSSRVELSSKLHYLQSNQYDGNFQYIDVFGNLISNIPGHALPDAPWQLQLKLETGTLKILGVKTYSDVPLGMLAALVGSHGWIEVACNGGSAAAQIANVKVGTAVSLTAA